MYTSCIYICILYMILFSSIYEYNIIEYTLSIGLHVNHIESYLIGNMRNKQTKHWDGPTPRVRMPVATSLPEACLGCGCSLGGMQPRASR